MGFTAYPAQTGNAVKPYGQQAHPHFFRMQMAYWLVTK